MQVCFPTVLGKTRSLWLQSGSTTAVRCNHKFAAHTNVSEVPKTEVLLKNFFLKCALSHVAELREC